MQWGEAVLILWVDLGPVTDQSATHFGVADKGGVVKGRLTLTVRLRNIVLLICTDSKNFIFILA